MSDEWGRGRSSKRKGAPRTNDISHKGESDTSHQGQTPQDALERGLLQDLIQSDQAGASPVLLPLEVISKALLFVDSATLTETRYVCQAFQALVKLEHWETAAGPARWLQKPTPAPESFGSPEQAEAYWRRWGRLAYGGVGSPAGRVVVIGGSEDIHDPNERNTDKTAAFLDVSWGEKIAWKVMPRMKVPRCAAAAAVDRHGVCHALGGWNADGANDTCERLPHPKKPSARPDALRFEDRPAVGPPASVNFAGGVATPGGWGGCEQGGWEALPSMQRSRCFLGASFEPRGALLAIGGGTGLYVDDEAFETIEVLRPDADAWELGPSMSQRRCGLGVTAVPDGKVYAVGGYGGNLVYLNSAEVFDPYSDRWTDLAPMRARRTGVALAQGPCGRLYAVGGSADGSHGHSTVERLDPREGKWRASPPMVFGRAFCCAAFGASGCLYVVGGMSVPAGLLSSVEVFDSHAERWKVHKWMTAEVGRPVADAALVFQH